MTHEEMLKNLDAIGAEVAIFRNTESWSSETNRWHVKLAKTDGEAQVAVSIFGSSFADAFERAYAKFVETAKHGIGWPRIAPPKNDGLYHGPVGVIDDSVPF